MTVELYALECGHVTIPHSFLIAGTEGNIRVPVPSYLIVHPKGRVLFDSGLNVAAQTDPEGYLTARGMRFNTFHFEPGEEVSARLEAIDVGVDTIKMVVNSHLHYDHAGGNAQLTDATIVVQRREWEHANERPDDDVGYRKADFDTGQPVNLLDGETDLFDDGSVSVFPTFGHTPGHQSLRVRTAAGEFVLCGDACYMCRSLDETLLPGVIHDPKAALESFKTIRRLRDGGARIMYGHDPDFWAGIPQAPCRLDD